MLIEVREVTPSLTEFEKNLNTQIQQVNCLAGQLYDQRQKMDFAEERFGRNQKLIGNMVTQRKKQICEIQSLAEKVIDAKQELDKVGFFDFKRKRVLRAQFNGYEVQLNREKARLSTLEADLAEKHKEVSEHPEKMAREFIPNFQMHLKQFKGAVLEYEKLRHMLFALTGTNLPEVKVEDVVSASSDGVIKVKKLEQINYITFMKPYKSFEKEM